MQIKNLKRLSHAIILPGMKKSLIELNDNFKPTEDIYTSREELKIEERSQETSLSNFRYVTTLTYSLTANKVNTHKKKVETKPMREWPRMQSKCRCFN